MNENASFENVRKFLSKFSKATSIVKHKTDNFLKNLTNDAHSQGRDVENSDEFHNPKPILKRASFSESHF